MAVSVVHVRKCVPPEGEKMPEWFLLTSLDIDRFNVAARVLSGTNSGDTAAPALPIA